VNDATPPFADPPAIEEPLHITPFELFRRLSEGETPTMIDLRADGATLRGATRRPELRDAGAGITLEDGAILIDWSDAETTRLARLLRAAGRDVRALYGGIELWDFALDPQVVGEERFLTD
jgi:hypothetical protein